MVKHINPNKIRSKRGGDKTFIANAFSSVVTEHHNYSISFEGSGIDPQTAEHELLKSVEEVIEELTKFKMTLL